MPAWEPPLQAPSLPPVVARPASLPATTRSAPPATTQKRRSSRREAQERIDEVALDTIEARIHLMNNAADEAVRLRAAEGLSAAAGLVAPQVSVNVSLVVDMDEALARLERLQVQRGEALVVESVEVP